MSKDAELNDLPVKKYPNLRPFPKGVSGNPGGNMKKLARLRKQLLKMAPTAMEKLRELVEAGDIQGLALWFKYALPVPKDPIGVDLALAGKSPTLPASLASILAAIPEDREQ